MNLFECYDDYGNDLRRGCQKMFIPDNPPTSIFFRFLASRTTTVNLPAVGTYRNEKQISPSLFSCQIEDQLNCLC